MYTNSIKLNPHNINKAQTSSNPSFKAVPLAKYKYLNDDKKDLCIFKLEEKDIDYLQNILSNIEKFFAKYEIIDSSTQEIFVASVEAAVKLLRTPKSTIDKTKILLAVSGDDPSAILIGNTLKVDKQGNFHYSSRRNHAKNETELDALVTWNSEIPCEGKAILCEYFHTLIKDKFKHLYVRSETPEYSFAQKFYEVMGLTALSDTTREMVRENENKYVLDIFDYGECEMVPMKATVQDIMKTITKRVRELKRKPIKTPQSVSLPKLIL